MKLAISSLLFLSIFLSCKKPVNKEIIKEVREYTAEEKELILAIDEEDFLAYDKKSKQYFNGKSLAKVNSEYLEIVSSIEIKCNCCVFYDLHPLLENKEEWKAAEKDLVKLFPDFHDKPELKIKRLVFSTYIHDRFDLEKDLKVWPDLLTNLEKFPERCELKIQIPALLFLRNHQNADGSWGETQKIYCSSLALLTFLSVGETPTSPQYGENIKKTLSYLSSQKEKLADKDRTILLFAFAEFYAITGISSVEKDIEKLLMTFVEKFSWNIESEPELFFLQCLALKSCHTAGVEVDFYSEFKNKLKAVKQINSLHYLAAAHLWSIPVKPEIEIPEIKLDHSKTLTDILMLYHLSLIDKNTHQAFKEISQKYVIEDLKVQYNKTEFSKAECDILDQSLSTFVYGYLFPRYLPSSKLKTKTDLNLIDELDLVK